MALAQVEAPKAKNLFLDYRQETGNDTRWEGRFTSQPGDWSGNVYDFYFRVYNKLKAALRVPFRLEGVEREGARRAVLTMKWLKGGL